MNWFCNIFDAIALGVPVDITAKSGGKGEGFCFRAQEELFGRWEVFFDGLTQGVYALTMVWLGLPRASVVSKAGELGWKGKILYSPETGMPIKRSDWDRFAEALRRFIDRKVADAGRRMVLQTTALGKILDRMLATNGTGDVERTGLSGLKYKGKTFDWISDSTKNMGRALGDSLTRQELARIEVASQSAANRVTHASEDMKAAIRQTVIDGIKAHKGKAQVSQDLYDRITGENRDFRRIADTEIQNATNTAYLKEEVFQSGGGGKIYFRRKEVLDGCTCGYCRKMDGKIAVWSDVPVPGGVRDGMADLAIWEGKEWDGKRLERIEDAPVGAFHPWCRGTWLRYYPELDGIEKKTVQKSLDIGTDTLEKSHKYIRRWLDTSGQWKYEYPNQYKGEHSAKHRAHIKAEIAKKTDLIKNVNPINPDDISAVNKQLDELEALSKNGKLKYRNMNVVFYKKKFRKHLETPKGKERDKDELKTRKALLPYIPHILENGRIDEISRKEKDTFIGIAGRALVNGIETGIEVTLVKKTIDKKMVLSLFGIDIKKSLQPANVFTNEQKRLADSQAFVLSDISDFNLNILYIGDSVNEKGE